MNDLLFVTLIFGAVITVVQYIVIILLVIIQDDEFVKSKEDFYLWLIPIYTPIKVIIKAVIRDFNEGFNKLK